MSCCSTDTAEDKLEPYQLRALYIRQISRFAQKGTFGQALNVFKEVSLCLSRYPYKFARSYPKKENHLGSTKLLLLAEM